MKSPARSIIWRTTNRLGRAEHPGSLGEQEYSDWRFRWIDCESSGGYRAARPVLLRRHGALHSRRAHGGGGQDGDHGAPVRWIRFRLHAALCVLLCRISVPIKEYKLGLERYGNWFEPAISAKDGKLSVPTGPGVGIKDMQGLLAGAVEV